MKTFHRCQIVVSLAIFAFIAGQNVHSDDEVARESSTPSFPVLSGIGAGLRITDAGPQITVVGPGTPAERGKLKEGDLILSIRQDNRTIDLRGKPLGEVVSLIRGPVGTTVTLEIARG